MTIIGLSNESNCWDNDNLSSIYPSKTKSLVDSDFNGDGQIDVFINDPNGRCQI